MTRKEFENHILNTYGYAPEYLWLDTPSYGVFRHQLNNKWFAIIMDIKKSKLGFNSDETISIVNLKCDPVMIGSLLNQKGVFPAYHMNKNHWISVALDDSVDDNTLKWLLDISYDLTNKKTKIKSP